jgi:Cu(I)/Ag(I) efflux system membrane fusion protein
MPDNDQAPLARVEAPDDLPEGEEAPPKGVRFMGAIRWAILGLTALVAISAWWSYALARSGGVDGHSSDAKPKYFCPMHPQIVADEPGECPICHMTLEPMPTDRQASGPARAAISPPSAALVAPGSTPPGTTPIKLALDRVQAIGVRTAVAKEDTVRRGLRVTAVVAPTEQGVAEVHVRSAGFVEQIFVNQTGISVGRDQPLLALYSPELYQAESELLSTRQWTKDDAGVRALESARRKLELLGMAPKDIDRVLEKGEAMRAVPIYAPQNGFVAKKNVVAGSSVTPEMVLYEIQDLSRVYVVAEVFERDIGSLHVGIEGTFTPAQRPERSVRGTVDLIYPTLNVQTRTTRVRMQLRNDKRALLPGEYGNVEFLMPPRKQLFVPRDAVVDTGLSTYVFVVESEGRFSPRAVVLGEEEGDTVAIRAGISPGDRVVSGATFMIDSESRLQASVAQAAQTPPQPAGPPSPSDGVSCEADFDRAKFPEKWLDCQKCVQVHHGMGSMEGDCKNAIPKPWR